MKIQGYEIEDELYFKRDDLVSMFTLMMYDPAFKKSDNEVDNKIGDIMKATIGGIIAMLSNEAKS